MKGMFSRFSGFAETSMFSGGGYRPMINYKWKTTISDSGERELLDSGTSPKYNAKLYSGRGCAFNGIDQSINGLNIQTADIKNITVTINGMSNKILGRDDWDAYLSFADYDSVLGLNYQEIAFDYRTDGRSHIISINIYYESADLYVDGVFVERTSFVNDNRESSFTSIGKTADSYGEQTTSNIMISKQDLTPTQIKYQYENPEKFLYREDDILKSEILNQSDIDNITVWFPMCETDEYVRDLVNYSEGVELIINGTFDTDTSSWMPSRDGVLSAVNGELVIENSSSGYSGAEQVFYNSVIGDTFLISFDYVASSGTSPSAYCIVSNSIAGSGTRSYTSENYTGSSETGTKTFVVKAVTDGDLYINLSLGGTSGDYAGDTLTVDNVSIKKLTGTYPINNYTDSCRDDAKNLSIGLQTCFWKRDALGIPYASSFNEFTAGGHDETGCTSHITLPNTYSIEIVASFDDITKYKDIAKFVGSVGITKYTNGRLYIYPKYDNSYYNLYVSSHTFVNNKYGHVVFSIIDNGITAKTKAYSNGVLSGSKTYDYTTRANVIIERLFYNRTSVDDSYFGIRLFKIHTKQQDPAKLYADAVKKGLLT